MGFQVKWTSKAVSDLGACVSFVRRVSLEAAKKLSSDLLSAANSLSSFPERFPEFSMPKSFPFVVRKFVVNGRYILLFAVEENEVVIYRVLDARKSFTSLL